MKNATSSLASNKNERDMVNGSHLTSTAEPESSTSQDFDFVQLGRSLELSSSSSVNQSTEISMAGGKEEEERDQKNISKMTDHQGMYVSTEDIASTIDTSASTMEGEVVSGISTEQQEKVQMDILWSDDDGVAFTIGGRSKSAPNADINSGDHGIADIGSSLESILHRFEITSESLKDSISTIASRAAAAMPGGGLSFVEQRDQCKKWLASEGCGYWILKVGLIVVLATMLAFPRMKMTTTSPSSMVSMSSPKQDLQSFVALERDRNDLDKLEDLRTQGFQRYARSACVSAESLEQAQRALSVQLTGLPEDVRTLVIERALIEGVTHRSSVQDSTSQLETHGRAQSYMAFWSTVYHPTRGRGRNHHSIQYETCVLVAGMEIGVLESIAGYKTEEKRVVVGTTPCECGYIYCAGTCPLFDKVVEKTPIFQRQSLSLKQQDDLHRWLVKNAIDAAEALVGGDAIMKDAKKLSNDGDRPEEDKDASWALVEVQGWKKPPVKESFYLDERF